MTGPDHGADRGAALTLAVTSSTGVMGLALGPVTTAGTGPQTDPGRIASIEIVTERRHAEEIGPRLQELLNGAGVGFAELDRLVVDVGPGRFTGLRVGLATVRALAFALDLPVVGLTSLAVLAAGHHGETESTAVTAVIDARRNEVFQQTFVGGAPAGPARVGPPAELAGEACGLVVGDGLDRYVDLYRAVPGLDCQRHRHPSAEVMLALGRGRPATAGVDVRPLYLREPDANPNITTRVAAVGALATGDAGTAS